MRPGAGYFTQPAGPAQRRYEALRADFVEELPAVEAADRSGYSTASIHQLATLLRSGRVQLFTAAKPGPEGPRKAGRARDRALRLRAGDHSVTEIAAALTAEGTPVSAQTVWKILEPEGIERLRRDNTTRRGTPARLGPVKAGTLTDWPAGARLPCDHAGLFLLLPARRVQIFVHAACRWYSWSRPPSRSRRCTRCRSTLMTVGLAGGSGGSR